MSLNLKSTPFLSFYICVCVYVYIYNILQFMVDLDHWQAMVKHSTFVIEVQSHSIMVMDPGLGMEAM